MDILWTPWRYSYVTSADGKARAGVPAKLSGWPGDLGCVFCNLMAAIDYSIANGMNSDEAEAAGGLILRGRSCFVCLNAFPYTSGHVMAMPYAHLDRLASLPVETAHELMDLAPLGTGVAGHLHLHALPRWVGDTSFLTTVAETRVLPEDLETTWRRMREAFGRLAG